MNHPERKLLFICFLCALLFNIISMASCSSNSPSSSSGGSFFLSYFGETEFNELLQLLGPGIEAGPDVNVASMTSRSFEDDTGGPSSSGLLSGPELDYYHIPVDIGNDTAKASSSSSSSLPVAGNDIDLSSYDTSILSTAISPIVNLARELGAYRIPRQPLRDELVRLYFRAVHPVFPVINEIDFCRSYFPSEGRELPEDIPLILFQAMMFAAFAHVNNTELRRSGFQSIHEAQYKTFQKVKLLYATARERNHLLLAKVSVLLSLWSPQDSSMHVNSYWVGRAVHHIRLSHASRPLNCSEKPRDRRRIVAWCCHNRDTMVAFGLRRPYRMHDLSRLISAMNPGQLHHDFDAHGSGIFDSVVIDETSRNRMISNFIWHCKFCQHIRTIVAFQRDLHFQKSWAGPDGDTIDDEHIRQVQEMTSKLGMLSLEHDDIIRSNPTASQSNSILVFDSVHPYMMKIMNLSTIVQLYLPYVNFDGSAACDEFSQEAVQKMRKASHAVASICGRLLAAVTLQHVPVYILAWIIGPSAVLLLEERYWTDTAASNGEGQNLGRSSHPRGDVQHLLRLLDFLKQRFLAGEYMCRLLAKMVHHVAAQYPDNSERIRTGDNSDNVYLKRYQMEASDYYDSSTNNHQGEREVLDMAMRLMELDLAYGRPGLQLGHVNQPAGPSHIQPI